MKSKKIVDETTNRGEFNRAYKFHQEQLGKLRCSYCKYHRGENCKNKYYGSFDKFDDNKDIRHPSWKIVSKNRKQWMGKPDRILSGINNKERVVYITINNGDNMAG